MTLDPILAAPPATQVHILLTLVALVATALILPLRKGTALHRAAGRVWAGTMMLAALSSFWIGAGFSWLHLMALVVLFYVLYGVRSIRRGQVAAHRAAMLGVAFGGLGVAGGFAVAASGRILRAAVFGG